MSGVGLVGSTAVADAETTVAMPTASDMARHAEVMTETDLLLNRITDVLPCGAPVCYVDYPVHLNIGDLLINQGTEAFFRRCRHVLRGRICFHDLCDWPDITKPPELREPVLQRLLALPKDTIFVLHGGGNFGDIYIDLDSMRQQLVARLTDFRVVLLPQSIHFNSADTEHNCLSSLLRHPDFHVFVRDEASLAAIRRVNPSAGVMSPDMAHALWRELQPYRDSAPSRGTLRMARQDVEAVYSAEVAAGQTIDWESLMTGTDRLAFRILRKLHHSAALGFSLTRSHRLWYRFRDEITRRAVALVADHADLRTDRLHGMILASLLARPVTFGDNTYGKLSRYHTTWLSESPILHPLGADAV